MTNEIELLKQEIKSLRYTIEDQAKDYHFYDVIISEQEDEISELKAKLNKSH